MCNQKVFLQSKSSSLSVQLSLQRRNVFKSLKCLFINSIQLNSVSFISLIDIFTPEREVSLPEKASVNKLYLGNLKWV